MEQKTPLSVILRRDIILYIDLMIIADCLFTGIGGLIRWGPYVGVAVAGICEPGFGAVTCYSAYPLTLIQFSVLMLFVSLKKPNVAIPLMLWVVSFGELSFFLVSLDPLKPFFVSAYFQPDIFIVWCVSAALGLFFLYRQRIEGQRIRPHWSWIFFAWVICDIAFDPFIPYFHTTFMAMLASQSNIALQNIGTWYMFRLNKLWDKPNESSDNRPYEADASVSLDKSLSA